MSFTSELDRKLALKRRCPTCGVPEGVDCMTSKGAATKPHALRHGKREVTVRPIGSMFDKSQTTNTENS